jgi:predicted secreted hydrolase
MNADCLLRQALACTILLLTGFDTPAFGQGFAELGRSADGFAEVTPGTSLEFPKDFGSHPDHRIEWWYLTANLEDEEGVSYGAQWTLFRLAIEPGPERAGWANQHVWMGHAAVTSKDRHLYAETFARGGVGQAGVITEPFRAWIDSWSLRSLEPSPDAGLSRLEVSASGPDFSYRFQLRSNAPLVLHGDQGYSRKSERGQASCYFSQPFFQVEGVVTFRGATLKVRGRAWMDREWSSQPLAPDQKGWDWFSLHFDTGEKVMLFQLRHDDGKHFRAGTWISPEGKAQPLGPDEITIKPIAHSTVAGRRLPTRWTLQIKSRGLNIESAPLNPQSWMGTSIPYWEGPIRFSGSHQGQGYLEMTGY